jgi:hypothetical protein
MKTSMCFAALELKNRPNKARHSTYTAPPFSNKNSRQLGFKAAEFFAIGVYSGVMMEV